MFKWVRKKERKKEGDITPHTPRSKTNKPPDHVPPRQFLLINAQSSWPGLVSFRHQHTDGWTGGLMTSHCRPLLLLSYHSHFANLTFSFFFFYNCPVVSCTILKNKSVKRHPPSSTFKDRAIKLNFTDYRNLKKKTKFLLLRNKKGE